MNTKQECLFSLLMLSLLMCGCASSNVSQSAEQQPAKKQPTEPEAKQDPYVIGQTTKAEVVAQWGKPTGRTVNEKHDEILTYNRSHMTGKQYIPFYFGTDYYRVKIYTFTFNKDGILIGTSTDEH